MTYWDKASQEQRLIQIDAGIELGMTSKQIAMCLRAPMYDRDGGDNAVKTFGNRHGRSFPTSQSESGRRAGRIAGRISRAVQFRKAGFIETTHKDAFSIFGRSDEPNPFNALLPEPVE